MNPVLYTTDFQGFAKRRDHLNIILSFAGLYVRDDGQVRWSTKATSLNQALERAGRLHAALASRGVHADVLGFCRAELLQRNYFHAVFEATKSIAAKIRSLSGLKSDGAVLVTEAFALGENCSPVLAINPPEDRDGAGRAAGLREPPHRPFWHYPESSSSHPEDRMADVRAGCARHPDSGLPHSQKAGPDAKAMRVSVPSNNRLQRTLLRAAAEPGR